MILNMEKRKQSWKQIFLLRIESLIIAEQWLEKLVKEHIIPRI